MKKETQTYAIHKNDLLHYDKTLNKFFSLITVDVYNPSDIANKNIFMNKNTPEEQLKEYKRHYETNNK
jgi:hypothetical protein